MKKEPLVSESLADRAARELVLDCSLPENFERAAAKIVARAIEDAIREQNAVIAKQFGIVLTVPKDGGSNG